MKLRRGTSRGDLLEGAVDELVTETASSAPVRPANLARLGDLLVERKLVSEAQLMEALLEQNTSGRRLGAVLVELGMLDERDLAQQLAEQQGLPVVDLRQDVPEPAALLRLPETVARSVRAVPIRETPEGLLIAVADSDEADLHHSLAQAAGGPVVLVIAPASDISRAINNSYRAFEAVDKQVRVFEAADEAARLEDSRDAKTTSLEVEEHAPVAKVVDLILTQALRDRASDVHIEPNGTTLRIRFRIDGSLHEVSDLPGSMAAALTSRIKIVAGMSIVEKRRPQDGQIETTLDGRSIDIRVSTTPTIFGEKCVLRLLDKSRAVHKLGDLGMPSATTDQFAEITKFPYGMVICAGPTGSGKTTTLYAAMNELDESERNLMTIEDPVEYVFPRMNQIQINDQAGLTFASGLRSILRQDPDVILVGEIRDVETARIAVQAALTGHFVLSSLHATDAAAALHRFVDMGLEDFLVASSVLAVLSQRLVRRICRHCKAPYEPTVEERTFFENAIGHAKDVYFHGAGCNFCVQTGFEDRIGVFELLRVTDEMRNLIMRSASHEEIRDLALSQGMRRLRDEALRLVDEDVTTVAEILRGIYLI